MANRMLK